MYLESEHYVFYKEIVPTITINPTTTILTIVNCGTAQEFEIEVRGILENIAGIKTSAIGT